MLRGTCVLRRSMAFSSLSQRPEFKQGKTVYVWKAAAMSSTEESGNPPGTVTSSTASSSTVPFALTQDNWALERFKLLGMPRGYPHTCARGFRRYFYMSVGAAFVGNFGTSIATQTLLGGFFAEASPRIWMLKDLAPAIFAAVIANKVISYEGRPKFWLVVYAILTNVSTITDMYIPSMVPPKYLLAAAVLTSMVKQSALLMFFVTRASCLQHFATHNNLAEFTKKFNSFGMVNFTVAMALGIAYTSFVTNFHVQLATVMVCCAANTTLNYLSVSRIAFRVLNPTTTHVVCHRYAASEGAVVLSPIDVSKVLGMWGTVAHNTRNDMTEVLQIGPCLSTLTVRQETLHDELIAHPSLPFAFGVWPLKQRTQSIVTRAISPLSRLCRAARGGDSSLATLASRKLGQDMRLSVLVGADCSNKHLMSACLMAYAALVETDAAVSRNTATIPQTSSELAAFLRRCCHQEAKDWTQKSEVLLSQLKEAGWETDSLSIDPADMRFSMEALPVPIAAQGDDVEVLRRTTMVDDDDDGTIPAPSLGQGQPHQTDASSVAKDNSGRS